MNYFLCDKYRFQALLLSWALLLTLLPAVAANPGSHAGGIKKGEVVYTQFSLFFEKGRHVTTNYRRGTLLPVNTPVTFVKASKNAITVTLADGRKVIVENIRDYSGNNINGILSRTFSSLPVDLSQFTEEERIAILDGKVNLGMGKKAVLIALGYPPAHKTPSLESNQWRYWSSRFGTFIVSFENDKVAEVLN